VGKFVFSVEGSRLGYGRKVRLADRGRGDHGAHQTDGQVGVKASNERVTGQKDEKIAGVVACHDRRPQRMSTGIERRRLWAELQVRWHNRRAWGSGDVWCVKEGECVHVVERGQAGLYTTANESDKSGRRCQRGTGQPERGYAKPESATPNRKRPRQTGAGQGA
jgi:hypothetical protein